MIEDKQAVSLSVPTIGITCSDRTLGEPYAAMIRAHGGEVRFINPSEKENVADIVTKIGGLLMAGGPDVNPKRYGENPIDKVGRKYNDDLDQLEINIVKFAITSNMPVLGICRGMQVLNVASRGKLEQSTEKHSTIRSVGDREAESSYHRIFISPGCRLASVVGSGGFVRVNSRHHQGVKESGKSDTLMSSAWSLEDGLIEALESPSHDWVLGVQFHPERRGELPPHFDKLFQALVEKAKHTI